MSGNKLDTVLDRAFIESHFPPPLPGVTAVDAQIAESNAKAVRPDPVATKARLDVKIKAGNEQSQSS
ncbi:MAG: hypothetical protein AAB574_00175 [Patescibacteria group bacterium]